jgi:phage terminase large subunit-like protein
MGAIENLVLADPTTAYAVAIDDGAMVAGPWVRAACKRHLADLDRAGELGLVWRPDQAQRAFAFFAQLRLADGEHAGQPFALQGWQSFIIGSLFGWYGADGFRRFRTAYVEIGKGNGKTPLAAGISLYMLLADGEMGAEVYSAAVTRDQAGICYRDALRFVQAHPTLMRACVPGLHNIAYPATNSYMRPLAAEGRSLDGLRVHCATVDELHEHRTSLVVDKVRAGTKGRRQALIFEITNSGFDRTSVCYQHHVFSLKVLNGIVRNETWFAFVASLDEGDDPLTDEACWVKANPNVGVSITEKYLREQVAEAREIRSRRNIVLRLNFCVWTEVASRWLDLESWDACASMPHEAELVGRECYGGLDLASTTDVAALVWLFPPRSPGEPWAVLPRFWVPADNIARRSTRDAVSYDQWADSGLMRTTDGNVVDYDVIRAQVEADAERFDVREIAIDRWNATQISTQLMAQGLTVVGFGQGFASMSSPSKHLEQLVLARQLAHGGHDVLRWMASNVSIAQDSAGNIKPDKARSTEKIDGIVALVMALGRADAQHEEDSGPSFWEQAAA